MIKFSVVVQVFLYIMRTHWRKRNHRLKIPASSKDTSQVLSPNFLQQNIWISDFLAYPAIIEFSSHERRVQTFNSPLFMWRRPQVSCLRLAEDGLYFDTDKDECVCYRCLHSLPLYSLQQNSPWHDETCPLTIDPWSRAVHAISTQSLFTPLYSNRPRVQQAMPVHFYHTEYGDVDRAVLRRSRLEFTPEIDHANNQINAVDLHIKLKSTAKQNTGNELNKDAGHTSEQSQPTDYIFILEQLENAGSARSEDPVIENPCPADYNGLSEAVGGAPLDYSEAGCQFDTDYFGYPGGVRAPLEDEYGTEETSLERD
ncbi:uncharacterized protein LOC131942919 [Physella acuta]|uniref:uncharacterized protein LOC131942919 n=1 Tax=Physella acuta TaxID=109671 RepID=UPI0027DB1A61|nr:uncharacterized protein LOC131942919 [Physella acuta]